MSETFTPGPWHVVGAPHAEIFNARFVVVSEHIDDAIIASLGGDVRGEEANARLIAAAPDLLEACLDLMGLAEREGWRHVAIIKAKAAISKAQGDSEPGTKGKGLKHGEDD